MLEGVLRGIEASWFQGEIADSAYEFQRKVGSGRRIVVGVNAFTEGNEDLAPPTLQIGAEVEELQVKRLETVRQGRSAAEVDATLSRLVADAGSSDVNLVPAMIDAVRAYASEGEIVAALASVFGRYEEDPVI